MTISPALPTSTLQRSTGLPSAGKPTGAACNLDCAYCFFLDKEALYPGSKFRMSDDDAGAPTSASSSKHHRQEVNIAWQGGEPT
jgi:uncharacterized protein